MMAGNPNAINDTDTDRLHGTCLRALCMGNHHLADCATAPTTVYDRDDGAIRALSIDMETILNEAMAVLCVR